MGIVEDIIAWLKSVWAKYLIPIEEPPIPPEEEKPPEELPPEEEEGIVPPPPPLPPIETPDVTIKFEFYHPSYKAGHMEKKYVNSNAYVIVDGQKITRIDVLKGIHWKGIEGKHHIEVPNTLFRDGKYPKPYPFHYWYCWIEYAKGGKAQRNYYGNPLELDIPRGNHWFDVRYGTPAKKEIYRCECRYCLTPERKLAVVIDSPIECFLTPCPKCGKAMRGSTKEVTQ